jgi:hypothetical protein
LPFCSFSRAHIAYLEQHVSSIRKYKLLTRIKFNIPAY